MKLHNISIKWKLFFYLLLLISIILVVLWLFQTVFLESFYKSIKIGQIKTLSGIVKANLESEDLQELIQRLEQDENIVVYLLDDQGEVLSSPQIPAMQEAMPMLLQRSEVMRSLIQKADESGGIYLELSRRSPLSMRPSNPTPEPQQMRPPVMGAVDNMIYVERAEAADGSLRYIYANARISPVNATVETLRIQLLYVTGILILLTLAIATLISLKISRPIMHTNQTAKRLAKGDYDIRFTSKGYREIVELNATLDVAAHELSRVESLRRELIANVSHDLRTPLTMITGFAEMIRDLPGENTPENAQVIVEESNRLGWLVSDLLDISKLQAGGKTLEKTRFCLTKSVRDTVERIASLMGEPRILCQMESDVWVEANETQILQVIYNLLTNALTHSDSVVEVRQIANENAVRIEVADEGEGIAAQDLPYVWDRYYKVDKTHKRAHVGTGLGLSIVKGVVEAHGGRYGVESKIGIGSVFWFELKM